MNNNKPSRKLMAIALSIVMFLASAPVLAAAETLPPGVNGEITAFSLLAEEVSAQQVPTGTALSELTLPGRLFVTAGGEQTDITVAWQPEPQYDGNTMGEYIFTPALTEGCSLADGVEPPQISVTVVDPMLRATAGAMAAATPDYSWYDANRAAHRFEIGSAAQLQGLADIVNGNYGAAFAFTGREISLTADIDLSGYENWTQIGANYNTFSGTFTGNSHTISGLTINAPAQSGVGLFGLLVGSVSDLYLSNVNITGYQNVGGIAGEVWGSISHCAVIGGMVSGYENTGGIAGKVNYNGSLLASCFTTCGVRATGFSPYSAGGVAGRVENGGALSGCYATGSVKPGEGLNFQALGGVVGSIYGGSIRSCFAVGEVTGTTRIGGVAGGLSGATTLENCAALNIRVAGDPNAGSYGGVSTGRVAGYVSGAQVINDIAFSGLILVNGGGNNANGSDKSSAQIKAEGFFEASGFSAPVWQSETEKLPILTGFPEGLQSGELPAHIGSPTPSAPQTLTAEPNDGSAALSWSAPGSSGASDISRYEVRKNNEGWISVGTAMTYTFTGLVNGTIYTFEVRAVNSYGNGAAASVQRVPVSSGNIAAIPGDRSVVLNWVTPSALIGRITDYWVRYDDASWRYPDENYLHTFFGLANGVNYTFEIWGIGMNGSTQGVLFSASVVAMPVGKPMEPANLIAVPGGGQIALSWEEVYSDEGSPVLRYEVSQDGGVNWVSVGMAMTYTFTGLTNGTAYPLQVRAVNAIGTGNAAAISATPRQPPAMISASSQSFPYGSGGAFTVSASGTPPIAYALSGQPGGVSMNESTGSVTVERTVPAGVYPFTVTAANGSPPDAVQNFSLTITPRTPQLSDLQYTAPSNRTYDGASTGIGPVTDKNAIGLSCTVYYQGISGTTYPRSQTPPKNAGQYEVIAAIAGNTNINTAELSLGTYRILSKSITVTPTAGQNKVYGQPDPPLQYTLSDALCTGDELTGTLARAAGENVGSYAIAMGTLTAGGNYTLSLSGSVSFAITPKADATFTIAEISPRTYTGSAITPEPQVKDGSIVLTKNVDFTYGYGNNTNAGVSAAVSITGVGNYAGSTGSAIFTINKAMPLLTLTANPAATQTRPGSVTLSAALPSDATGTLIFRAGTDTIAAVTLPMKTAVFTPTGAANAYSFTVEYSGDSNYEGKTSTALEYGFIKSDQAALNTTDGTVSFGDPLDLSTLVSGGSGTGAFSFAVTGGPADLDSVTLTPTGVGTVNITVTKAADHDYNEKSAIFTVTVIPRVIIFTVAPVQPQTYTGSAITPEPEVKDGDIFLTEGIDFAYGYSGNTNIGAFAAVNITGIGNYAGSTGSTTFTIGKAAPNILTPPAVSGTIYAGAALSKIPLTGGSASVGGRFEWANPSAAAVRGENTFEARFVPDDTVNYLEVEGISITFTAKTRPDGGSTLFAAKPNQPTAASVTAAAQVTNGRAALTITGSIVRAAIDKALADAKAGGNAANGISVTISVTATGATGFTLTLERNALNRLLNARVKSFGVSGLPVNLGFDTEALRQIQTQSGGDVVITVKPAAVTGLYNAYDITITSTRAKKAVGITSLGRGSIILSISAVPGRNESGGYLYGAYVSADNKINRIANSAYDASSKRVILSINHFSVYGVGYSDPSAGFFDIAKHWAKDSIDYAVGRGLLSGTSGRAFSPDAAITRGILATALGRLSGADVSGYKASSFRDVKAGSVLQPYIEWAYREGIMQGVGNSQFAPDRAVTREEIAVILQNYAKATGCKLPATREAVTFADASSIGNSCKTAVTAMQQAGVMMGRSDNRFHPKSSATRAEVSAILHRYVKLTVDPATAQGWARNDDGGYMYYQNGAAVTGSATIDGVKYYFDSIGVLQAG